MKGPCRILQLLSFPEVETEQGVFPDNTQARSRLFNPIPSVIVWSSYQPKVDVDSKTRINLSRMKWFKFQLFGYRSIASLNLLTMLMLAKKIKSCDR